MTRFAFDGHLEIDQFLGCGPPLVEETEFVFAALSRGEDGVELSLLAVVHYDLVVGANDAVVNVEGAAGLNLGKECTGQHATCRELRADFDDEMISSCSCSDWSSQARYGGDAGARQETIIQRNRMQLSRLAGQPG